MLKYTYKHYKYLLQFFQGNSTKELFSIHRKMLNLDLKNLNKQNNNFKLLFKPYSGGLKFKIS